MAEKITTTDKDISLADFRLMLKDIGGFAPLWEEEQEGGLLKLAPVFVGIINLIIGIVIIWKM